MSRGQAITGYWALFPGTTEEPKRFTSKEDALESWPETKVDSVYMPVKVVFRVTWDIDTDAVLKGGKHAWPERGGDVVRSDFVTLTNPLSPEGFLEEVQALKDAALEKKNAKKAAGNSGENPRLEAMAKHAEMKRAAKKAQRQAYARGRD